MAVPSCITARYAGLGACPRLGAGRWCCRMMGAGKSRSSAGLPPVWRPFVAPTPSREVANISIAHSSHPGGRISCGEARAIAALKAAAGAATAAAAYERYSRRLRSGVSSLLRATLDCSRRITRRGDLRCQDRRPAERCGNGRDRPGLFRVRSDREVARRAARYHRGEIVRRCAGRPRRSAQADAGCDAVRAPAIHRYHHVTVVAARAPEIAIWPRAHGHAGERTRHSAGLQVANRHDETSRAIIRRVLFRAQPPASMAASVRCLRSKLQKLPMLERVRDALPRPRSRAAILGCLAAGDRRPRLRSVLLRRGVDYVPCRPRCCRRWIPSSCQDRINAATART